MSNTTALATLEPQIPQLTGFVEVLPLVTATDIETATNFLRQVKTLEKELDAERKALVEPLKAESSAIDARYREPRRALERIESMLKKRIGEVHAAADQARAAALTAASEAAQSGDQAAAVLAIAQASAAPPETPGVSVRYKWVALVADVTKIPRDYMMVDGGKLAAVSKAHGTGPTAPAAIAGVEWTREPIVSARGCAG